MQYTIAIDLNSSCKGENKIIENVCYNDRRIINKPVVYISIVFCI